MYNTLRMCQSASLSVLPSCQHTSGLLSQPHSVARTLWHQPTGCEWKTTCNISKPGAEEEYGSSRLEERQPLGKTWKVKIVETFLSWIQKWLHESKPHYDVGWQVPLGRLETDLSVFFFFLTLYIWGLITIIATCIKLNKTLLFWNPWLEASFLCQTLQRVILFMTLNYTIMDHEKCSLHIYFVYNENT